MNGKSPLPRRLSLLHADTPGKIDENDLAYRLFIQHGFQWGGSWKTMKDYQHFEWTE